ncbi:MAG: dihydrofolate reductase family protein [Kofleriaceae bacterium]
MTPTKPRKLYAHLYVTVDGLFEGPSQDLSWFHSSDEMVDYHREMLHAVDTVLFGRASFEMLAPYWPAETGPLAERLNALPKLVLSRTLARADWNARVVSDVTEIARQKQQPGRDMVLFAGASALASLHRHGLLDEIRLLVNPVVLGRGRPVFAEGTERCSLALAQVRTFRTGNVLLTYVPGR